MESIINTELEASALALFSRDLGLEYKRVLCYIVASELPAGGGARQVKTLIHNLRVRYQYNAEDVRCALSVLKSPFAFDSLKMWNVGTDQNLLCSCVIKPKLGQWLGEIEEAYPHVRRMIA